MVKIALSDTRKILSVNERQIICIDIYIQNTDFVFQTRSVFFYRIFSQIQKFQIHTINSRRLENYNTEHRTF